VKNATLQPTHHHNGAVHDEREDRSPEIILHYNRTKGAVDNVDKLVRTYTRQRHSTSLPSLADNILPECSGHCSTSFVPGKVGYAYDR